MQNSSTKSMVGDDGIETSAAIKSTRWLSKKSATRRFLPQRAAAFAKRLAYLRLLALLGCAALWWWVL